MLPRHHSYMPMHQQMRRPHPGMYPGYYRPMQGEPPSHHMTSNRPMQMPARQRQGQRGGLLAKLFGNNGNQRGASRSLNALGGSGVQNANRAGSMLQSLTNPASINGFLANTQKVLNTAQQMGPIVQQYGPIMKNLPAMWRMYKGLKNAPDLASEEETATSSKKTVTENNVDVTSESERSVHREEILETKSSKWKIPSPSTPKMYI